MRILFLGSDDFSTSILKTIIKFPKVKVDVLGPSADKVFYNNKDIKTEVIPKIVEFSKANNIPYSQTLDSYKQQILDNKYEMLITASFNAFIDKSIINKFPMNKCINIHPSLLPYYKGAAPIQRTLLDNAEYTGVTIQTLHPEKFDHGRILLQSSPILTKSLYSDFRDGIKWKSLYRLNDKLVEIDESFDDSENTIRKQENDDKTGVYFTEKYSHLRNSLTIVGSKLMHQLFVNDNYKHIQSCENDKLIDGRELDYKKFSTKLSLLDFEVKWRSKTAGEIQYLCEVSDGKIYTYFKRIPVKNKINHPWTPERLYLKELKVENGYKPLRDDLQVGMFEIRDDAIVIKCKDDTYIECKSVRPVNESEFVTISDFKKLLKKHYKHSNLKFETINDVINEYDSIKQNEKNSHIRIPAVQDLIRLKSSLKNTKSKVTTLTIE